MESVTRKRWRDNLARGGRCTTTARYCRGEGVTRREGIRGLGLGWAYFALAEPAQAKLKIPRRKPSGSYEERKRRIEEAQRRREEKEDEEVEDMENVVTLPSGVQFRDIVPSSRPGEALPSSVCDICFVVYRLAPGAYFKYSSGGTPIYMFSQGYGNEGKDDVGSTFTFTLGDINSVPLAVANAMVGMREGGTRRVLVPPYLGWDTGRDLDLVPDTFGGRRRLENHRGEPLLVDVELVKVRKAGRDTRAEASKEDLDQTYSLPAQEPFQLPRPPTPL
ncbi:peptidyl-prolyl cis-trans isomerase [Chloropicon primus]|uniref:Peptidyl-prolyl cis-trans isomerase n=1 Tax=Chloropicon primus TaxID=1764295 RepID=A0A5B8MBB6_9CHLO|nr:peptidyl-prolyl cis-trans isomerase [Chloropicon primus]UPQ96767.1 peptidyl-prolyl cis-trans isomerase [Chloropicon primus]|eukprot:QDZ17549.1 peptidyl-prolyl cis-trans isomerase [Chloropicon primus]